MTTTLDQVRLLKDLEAIAEFLQAGGSLEEILNQIRDITPPTETPPGDGTAENEGGGAETPPETPPDNTGSDPPGGGTETGASG